MAKKKPSKAKKTAKKKTTAAKKTKKALPVPKGYHTVQTSLVLNDSKAAIAWYVKAFGAKVLSQMEGPDGKVMHAEVRIGDSIVMMNDEMPDPSGTSKSPTSLGGHTSSLMLYVKDVDGWVKRAAAAGAKVTMPVADQFWGDRYGQILDPFGHAWGVATRKVDMTPKQMKKAAEEFFKQMAAGEQQAA